MFNKVCILFTGIPAANKMAAIIRFENVFGNMFSRKLRTARMMNIATDSSDSLIGLTPLREDVLQVIALPSTLVRTLLKAV